MSIESNRTATGEPRAPRVRLPLRLPLPRRLRLGAAYCFAIFGVAALGYAADPVAVPPLSDSPTNEHHVGKVVWEELVTPDLASAEHFYGGLLGWTFKDLKVGNQDYALALLDGRPIAGLVQRPEPAGARHQYFWLTFLGAADVDAVKRAALSDGGKVIVQPRTYPARGRQALLADPQGAVFGVIASQTGDPPDYLADPGEWIWSVVLTRNPDTDARFYKKLFGYDVFDLPSEDGLRHVVLSNDDYARAGVNSLPADSHRRRPHWLDFVRVSDASEMATKAVALGGRVLVEPRVDRHGGRLAVIADPAGAPFGVMEWTASDSHEEAK
jgi:predicted enzyme related to lactoylglutathione lyase